MLTKTVTRNNIIVFRISVRAKMSINNILKQTKISTANLSAHNRHAWPPPIAKEEWIRYRGNSEWWARIMCWGHKQSVGIETRRCKRPVFIYLSGVTLNFRTGSSTRLFGSPVKNQAHLKSQMTDTRYEINATNALFHLKEPRQKSNLSSHFNHDKCFPFVNQRYYRSAWWCVKGSSKWRGGDGRTKARRNAAVHARDDIDECKEVVDVLTLASRGQDVVGHVIYVIPDMLKRWSVRNKGGSRAYGRTSVPPTSSSITVLAIRVDALSAHYATAKKPQMLEKPDTDDIVAEQDGNL